MVTIALGKLKDSADSLSKFLQERMEVEVKVEGDSVVVQGKTESPPNKKSLKTYVKRFLYNNDVRDRYRVGVSGDKIELFEVEKEEKE